MKKTHIFALTAFLLSVCFGLAFHWSTKQTALNKAFYQPAITAFNLQDIQSPPPKNAVLFVGSSSVKLWPELNKVVAPYSVIQRGFGGAQTNHILYHFEDLILKYAPKIVFIYVGENDIATPYFTPEMVSQRIDKLFKQLARLLPDTHIIYMSVKTAKSRQHLDKKIEHLNEHVFTLTEQYKNIEFLDTGRALIQRVNANQEIYIQDGIHLNKHGYNIWNEMIKNVLFKHTPVN